MQWTTDATHADDRHDVIGCKSEHVVHAVDQLDDEWRCMSSSSISRRSIESHESIDRWIREEMRVSAVCLPCILWHSSSSLRAQQSILRILWERRVRA